MLRSLIVALRAKAGRLKCGRISNSMSSPSARFLNLGRAVAIFVLLILASIGGAQPYGISSRPPVGPFLDGALPKAAPGISGNWSAVPAFTGLLFTNALGLTFVPGTSNLIVWEREGRIWSFVNSPPTTTKTLVLDIHNQCQGWDDSGLLGAAFHPGFLTNRFLFVYYTWVVPGTVVGSPTQRPPTVKNGAYHDRLSRFTLDASGVAIPGSELVFIDQVADNIWHNGGGLFFHPTNGFLYYTDGDDENGPTQVIDQNLLSGVFRIDVDRRGGSISHPIPRQPARAGSTTANYYIPNDNPFVGQTNALEEFYALGLRSPHRMTYDPPSGRIFIGDVGAGSREEIDIIEPTDAPGQNFQWSRIEGLQGDLVAPYIGINHRPILDYDHGEGQAVIGGYVYRGTQFAADLGGKYIFGDNVQGKIWAMDDTRTPAGKTLLCVLPKGNGPNSGSDYTGLSSFGLDANNEFYLCQMSSQGGRIYKLARSGPPPVVQEFPALLSQTGAFTDTANMTPAAALIPYDVNSPLWSDGAAKKRWMIIPTNTQISLTTTGEWTFPNGTVLVKHFELPVDDADLSAHRRLETRFLVRGTNGLYFGATYKWRPDNSDADLLADRLDEDIAVQTASGQRIQTWHYPSRTECLACHNTAANGVLGVKTRQSNRDFLYPGSGVMDNQLRSWNHIGLFSQPLDEAAIPGLAQMVAVTNAAAPLELRVRSYLDANCGHCHRPGGARAFWDARFDTPLASAGIVNGLVSQTLGVPGAKVVVPGSLAKSILYLRDSAVDGNKMPPLARNRLDVAALATIAQWISALPPSSIQLPGPWSHQDIGAVGLSGDATYAGGSFAIAASGDDIWGQSDAFHYVLETLTGDGRITARVAALGNSDGWAKAGVMIRETLTANSSQAMSLVSSANGTAFQRRPSTGADSVHTAGPAGAAPWWVRLSRTNNVFTSEASANGVNWTLIDTATIPMARTIFIGLAATAHNNATVNTAQIDNVSVSGQTAGFGARINFQLATTATPAGYLGDSGLAFGDRGNGYSYGWDADTSANTRERNSAQSPDKRYDTFVHLQKQDPARIWEIAVPNGNYRVHTVSGDSDFFDGVEQITAEGEVVANGAPSAAQPWVEGTNVIAVSDGRLTITVGPDAVNAKLSFLEFAVDQAFAPPTVALLNPTDGATFTMPSRLILSADATAGAGVAQVEFLAGSMLLGRVNQLPWSLVWTNPMAGSYQLRAIATDTRGVTNVSRTVDVIVDPLSLAAPRILSNGWLVLGFPATPLDTYLIEDSTNLVDWSALQSIQAQTNWVQLDLPSATNPPVRYFRINRGTP